MAESTITVLVDNTDGGSRLATEHGFSLWIETGGTRILFDAGQSDACLRNAEALNIDPATADLLIISHGHYDHTGAVASLLDRKPDLEIYCHPEIFTPRYSRQADGAMKPVGLSRRNLAALHERIETIHWICEPLRLKQTAGVTGPIPRTAAFEDTGGDFYLDLKGERPDPITDDLAMWFETAGGLVLVTGCCHSGLINTINYVRRLSGTSKIRAIIGGFHLVHASAKRLHETCAQLEHIRCGHIIPCHCTGEDATSQLRNALGNAVASGGTGRTVQFSDS